MSQISQVDHTLHKNKPYDQLCSWITVTIMMIDNYDDMITPLNTWSAHIIIKIRGEKHMACQSLQDV